MRVSPSIRLFVLFSWLLSAIPSESQQQVGTISIFEAAQSVIEKHPLVEYQRLQTVLDEGLRLQASSIFDTTLTSSLVQSRTATPLTASEKSEYALIGVNGGTEITDITQFNFGVSRLFRSGISLNGTTLSQRNVDNLINPSGINTTAPVLQVTIPLLRSRGRRAVAAPEDAAKIEVTASSFDLTNEVTSLLTSAATDYWSVVANQKLLKIALDAEDRARTDLNNTQTLVEADRLPRENLNEVNANLAQSSSLTIVAQQNLIASQYQLAADIGMAREQIVSTALVARDDFPSQTSLPDPAASRTYVDEALTSRSDYLALQLRVKEQAVLLLAAKNHLLPELNVTANAGYNGLAEGRRFKDFFTSSVDGVTSYNASGGLSYSFPPRNELARGAYTQVFASQKQLELQSEQLMHTITSAVIGALQAVVHAARETDKARAAVAFYQDSLAGQREKYHLGMASVVDVLTVEDRLTTALTTEVQAELAYAQALVQLRSTTGTFVAPGKASVTLSSDIFTRSPQIGTPERNGGIQ